MSAQIIYSFPVEKLTDVLTESILKKLTPVIQSANQPQPKTELLTRRQAATLLGISLPTLCKWTHKGKVAGYRIGTRIRYKRAELENSLAKIQTRN